jgi:hypothetical protein
LVGMGLLSRIGWLWRLMLRLLLCGLLRWRSWRCGVGSRRTRLLGGLRCGFIGPSLVRVRAWWRLCLGRSLGLLRRRSGYVLELSTGWVALPLFFGGLR